MIRWRKVLKILRYGLFINRFQKHQKKAFVDILTIYKYLPNPITGTQLFKSQSVTLKNIKGYVFYETTRC